MSEIWTVQSALNWCQGYLERHNDPNPRLSAQWLLSYATGLSRIEVYMHFDKPLSCDERGILRDAVARRGKGEPLQYIQNSAPFRLLSLYVEPGVLIPRPETEVLVDEALKMCNALKSRCAQGINDLNHVDASESVLEESSEELGCENTAPLSGISIVDCCTGSGCIACSLAYERPDTSVIATDISSDALRVAQRNVDHLHLESRVQVKQMDLLEDCESDSVDIIVSNPPYIPDAVMQELPYEVAAFEPEIALAGGMDGMDIFRRMLPQIMRVLHVGGSFICELHETCLEEAQSLSESVGFKNVHCVCDLTQRPRFVIGYKGE